ncbi:DNA polymerase III subunit gamma/tau [Treponema pedis]|uniref:DNA polymerase III subunit gamma/tau n=1 Tax=Treponema pedis TaxID=409322 RepID=UPI000410B4C9|nr:DNA polymerase III subunit gamma/tau [Treponema pedis]
MFENLINQPAAKMLTEDIRRNKLPPSILFSGNVCSGKLTAALELARSVCCETDGNWQCTCSSCLRQKELISPDVLILGARDHTLEINAAAKTFLNNITLPSRYLFLRSIRKLTCRFDARLWDTDEQRFLKAAPLVAEIEEAVSELTSIPIENLESGFLTKKISFLIEKSEKLQEECMYDSIPINQVRKASSWVRLMPTGSKKVLIIENADKMQEGARNAFLKILEEPPSYSVFVLTTAHRGAIMPTILSRVRTYNFIERDEASQEEVIRRVFKGDIQKTEAAAKFNLLSSYLYGFLPVEFQTIKTAAALFYEFVFMLIDRENKILPHALYNAVTKYKAENTYGDFKKEISSIVSMLNKFKPHTIYILFLNALLSFLGNGLKDCECTAFETETYFKITQLIKTSETSVDIFNISPQAALENLAEQIKEAAV